MWGRSSLTNYWWTYISDYRTSGRRRATPAADSIYFPGRLLMQDERSVLHIDKAKLWTPAYGLILSFPGKKAANKANPWAASSFTLVSRSPNFRFCFALSTGLSQEADSRKGDLLVSFGHGLIRRHLSSENFGYVWSHLGTSRHKAQPLTHFLSPIHHLSGCTTWTQAVQRETVLDPRRSRHIGHVQDSHHRHTLCIRGPSPASAHTPPATAHKGLNWKSPNTDVGKIKNFSLTTALHIPKTSSERN